MQVTPFPAGYAPAALAGIASLASTALYCASCSSLLPWCLPAEDSKGALLCATLKSRVRCTAADPGACLSTAPGISASPAEDNLRYFNVMILGPQQSPYEGGAFKLELFLPSDYPMAPPKVSCGSSAAAGFLKVSAESLSCAAAQICLACEHPGAGKVQGLLALPTCQPPRWAAVFQRAPKKPIVVPMFMIRASQSFPCAVRACLAGIREGSW